MKRIHPLKLKRLELGLSQIKLASLAGVTQTQICYTEKGLATLKKNQKKRVAKVLKTSIKELFPMRRDIGKHNDSLLTGGERK